MTRASMHAQVGDHLMADGDPRRSGVIIDVPNPDGSPPYVVKWLADGHIAMVFPDSYSSIVPAGRSRPAIAR